MSDFSTPPEGPAKPSSAGVATAGAATAVTVMVVVLIVVVLVTVVCGGIVAALLIPAVSSARTAAQEAMHKNNLKQLGIAYHICMDANQAGPESWDDLTALNTIDQETITALQDKYIEVVWGFHHSTLDNSPLPASEIILAYPSDPALGMDETCSVLMADASVRQMLRREVLERLSAWEQAQGASAAAEAPE